MKREQYVKRFKFVLDEIGLLAFCNDEDFKPIKEPFMLQLAEMLIYAETKLLKIKSFES